MQNLENEEEYILPTYCDKYIDNLIKDKERLKLIISLDYKTANDLDIFNKALEVVFHKFHGFNISDIYNDVGLFSWLEKIGLDNVVTEIKDYWEIDPYSSELGYFNSEKFIKIYDLDSIITFGDFKGATVRSLIGNNKSYIILNYIDKLWHFSVDYTLFFDLKLNTDIFYEYLFKVFVKNDIARNLNDCRESADEYYAHGYRDDNNQQDNYYEDMLWYIQDLMPPDRED